MSRGLRDPAYTKLRQRLIAAREKSGLTQVELAGLVSRTQSFVSKYELGERRLDVIDFLSVCRSLKADPLELLKGLE